MPLEEEILKHSAKVSSTSYSMSVGELIAMYRDKELDLHPEFQRFFRWTPEQKSRLVESLLLGIPIPPIFVSERADSKWDVIDGLQRLSTILELMGELRGPGDERRPALTLTRTKYLRNLDGLRWEDENNSLPDSARIKIKRARLDVNIVKNVSDQIAKYEIFQRLNSGGSNATDQEVRNCILVMRDSKFYNWLSQLAHSPEFLACVPLTDRAIEEAFDQELVVRFLVLTLSDVDELRAIDELGTFLTDQSLLIAEQPQQVRDELASAFNATFGYLAEHLGGDAFRRFDPGRSKYLGAMLISIYEVVAVGLGRRFLRGHGAPDVTEFVETHKKLWSNPALVNNVGSGVRASTRIPRTVEHGRSWLVP
jgi:hypothetical protein